MAFTYDPVFAVDPNNPVNVAKNASITIFDPADPTQAPIAITDPTGSPLPNPFTVDAAGMGPAYQHPTLARVGWKGAGFTGYFTSYEGMLNETQAARAAAQSAAGEASTVAAERITSASVNPSGRLVFTKANAQTVDVGSVLGPAGPKGDKGTDGAAVLPTQEAIEQAIIQDGPAKTALNARYETPVVMATPDRFPAIDNTGATFTQLGLQQAIDAAPVGGRVTLRGTYLLNGRLIVPPSKLLTLDLSAATLVRGGADPLVDCIGTFDAQYTIASITTEAITIFDQSTTVTKLTMSAAPNWQVNDRIKIVSDDVIPGGHVTNDVNKPRLGEFAEVHSISGTTVYLKGLLWETYTTAPRAARLPYGTMHIVGGTVDVSETVITNKTNGSAFRLHNLVRPSVTGLTIKRQVGMGLSFKSCAGYYVENFGLEWAMNSPTDSIYGYGIHDSSCQDGVVQGGTQRSGRHPFTDGTADIPAGSTDTASYGSTLNAKIVNVTSRDMTAAAFDTHHNSRGTQFINCTGYGSPELEGFLLRGRDHRVIGGTLYGCRSVVAVLSQVTGGTSTGESNGHYVSGVRAFNTDRIVTLFVRGSTHPNAGVRDPRVSVTVENVVADGLTRVISSINGNVRMRNIDANFAALANGAWLEPQNSILDVENLKMDGTAVTSIGAGTQRVLNMKDETSAEHSIVRLDGVRLKASSTYMSAAAAPFVGTVNSERLTVRNLRFESTWAAADPFASVPTSVPQSIQWGSTWESGSSQTWRASSGQSFSNAALAGSIATLTRSTDPQLVLTANITDSTARTMAAFPVGQYDGQRLTIIMGSATAGLTIPHGASFNTRLTGNANAVLSTGNAAVHLLWSSGAWRQ